MNGSQFPNGESASLTLDNFEIDNTPYLSYLDGETTFDTIDDSEFMSTHNDESIIGHEKRKNSDLDAGSEEEIGGDHKRKEGDDKQAKKPGRKPLTSEPTTVRSMPLLETNCTR